MILMFITFFTNKIFLGIITQFYLFERVKKKNAHENIREMYEKL